MEKTYKIYLITNTANGKQYVGQTVSLVIRRWYAHTNHAKHGYRGSPVLHSAIKKYGKAGFSIGQVSEHSTLDEVNQAETDLIASLGTMVPNGYNVSPGGRDPTPPNSKATAILVANNKARAGRVVSDETRRAMQAAALARPKRPRKPKPAPQPSRSTSGYVGVTYCKRSRAWKAVHHTTNVYKFIGTFDTAEEAAAARARYLETGHLPPRRRTGPKPKLVNAPGLAPCYADAAD